MHPHQQRKARRRGARWTRELLSASSCCERRQTSLNLQDDPSRSRSEMRHERAQRAPTMTERPICHVSIYDLPLQRGKFASAKNDSGLKVQFSVQNAYFESFKTYPKFGRFGSAARFSGLVGCRSAVFSRTPWRPYQARQAELGTAEEAS